VTFCGIGCGKRLLECCQGHQALIVPALHVNGPTGAELEGILSAAPLNAGYTSKPVSQCAMDNVCM
jgi:hypothetical protein